MQALYLLIPMAVLFVLVAGIAFFLTIRSGQYDDMDGVSHRILMDDDDPRIPHNQPVQSKDGRAGDPLCRSGGAKQNEKNEP
ncbi:MAG: cbb3-type cytochrome oxidase assembly protein CcoS [Thioalkalivibrionaceae bacterium]